MDIRMSFLFAIKQKTGNPKVSDFLFDYGYWNKTSRG